MEASKLMQYILRDFRNAPFYIHFLFHMVDLRIFFSLSFFYPLVQLTMIRYTFDSLMLFILT